MIPSERNETTGTWQRSSKRTRDEFDARDLWCAAWLHANGLPFLRCYRHHQYTRWVFGDRDAAWDLSYQWRFGGPDATVHGPTLMLSYKAMKLAAQAVGFGMQQMSGREASAPRKDDGDEYGEHTGTDTSGTARFRTADRPA